MSVVRHSLPVGGLVGPLQQPLDAKTEQCRFSGDLGMGRCSHEKRQESPREFRSVHD